MFAQAVTWLEVEPQGFREKVKIIANALGLDVASQILLLILFATFGYYTDSAQMNGDKNNTELVDMMNRGRFVIILLLLCFVAGTEELLFRVVPITIARFVSRRNRIVIIGTALTSSILFGLLHDFSLHGLLFQGIGGVTLSVVYLKCGGFGGHHLKAFACSTSAHFIFNLLPLTATVFIYLFGTVAT